MWTVSEFSNNSRKIDCNPIGQRPPVHTTPNNPKTRSIISSMIRGQCIGLITLVECFGQYDYESIDGGHRKRGILDFYNGNFGVCDEEGRMFHELSDEEQKAFENYELLFSIYSPLDNETKGRIFRDLNTTTDCNKMEKLNSSGMTHIACLVRGIVRVAKGMDNKLSEPHSIFEKTDGNNFRYLEGNNNRLVVEWYIARLSYGFYKEGGNSKFCSHTDKKHERMYYDDNLNKKKVSEIEKKLNAFLDFLFEVAKYRKGKYNNGIGMGERIMLFHLYIFLTEKESFEFRDVGEWYDAVKNIHTDYSKDPDEKYQDILSKKEMDRLNEKTSMTIQSYYCHYSRNWDCDKKQVKLCEWITTHPLWKKAKAEMIYLDPKRSFSKDDKEAKLQEQKGMCYIDGKPLKIKDAHAAHNIAHRKGGRTEMSNLFMVRKTYNIEMGQMTVTEFKKQWDKKQEAEAA